MSNQTHYTELEGKDMYGVVGLYRIGRCFGLRANDNTFIKLFQFRNDHEGRHMNVCPSREINVKCKTGEIGTVILNVDHVPFGGLIPYGERYFPCECPVINLAKQEIEIEEHHFDDDDIGGDHYKSFFPQALEEEEFRNSQPQEDPIASDLSEMEITEQVDEDSNNILESEQGADEELCIIPDTERVISQEERDAAAAMVPIRDPTESDTSNSNSVLGVDQPKNSTINSTSEDKFVVSKCTEDSLHSCIQCMVVSKRM